MNIITRHFPLLKLNTGLFFLIKFGLGAEQINILRHFMFFRRFPKFEDADHLRAAVEWLAHAQDICGGNGVSSAYYFKTGWGVAYPETSGYILSTFLAYADYSCDDSFLERSIKIGDWEIEIQSNSGGVFSSMLLQQTRVFNTAQVILGWCTLYLRIKEEKYINAAIRAGDYIVSIQEPEGTWIKDTYCGARTYHARVDWALLYLAQITCEQHYAKAAIKNLKWIIKQQQENGWFSKCGFNNDNPITHVIAYTLRGLLECSQMDYRPVQDLEILPKVIKSATQICHILSKYCISGIKGMIPSSFDENWESKDNDSCLTGNAQLACFFYRLAHCTGDFNYLKYANLIMSATEQTQLINTTFSEIKGAIAGSYPLFRGYVTNGFPSWAAKFFSDALLMKLNFHDKLVIPS